MQGKGDIATTLERWRSTGAAFVTRAESFARTVWHVSTLSLADGLLWPKKGVVASIEKGAVQMIHATQFLSRIKVRESRSYTCTDECYTKPEVLASTIALAGKELKAAKRPITLSIPPEWVIVRTAQLPSTVKEHLGDVIGYELDRLTPFSSESSYYDFKVLDESGGHVQILLTAAKAAQLDPYLQALKEEGVVVEKVTTSLPPTADGYGMLPAGEEPSGDTASPIVASFSNGAALNMLSRGTRKRTRPQLAVTLVLALLLLATWVPYTLLPLQQEEKRLAQIEQQIAMRKTGVREGEALRKEVKSLSEEVEAIGAFKKANPMMLVMLKELTTIMPKNTWVTRTRITDTIVEIEGYAKSASEILPKLEESKYLRKVEFSSPTIRDTKMEADRFVIKAEIEGFGPSVMERSGNQAVQQGEKRIHGKK